jgi:hypothetical protein
MLGRSGDSVNLTHEDIGWQRHSGKQYGVAFSKSRFSAGSIVDKLLIKFRTAFKHCREVRVERSCGIKHVGFLFIDFLIIRPAGDDRIHGERNGGLRLGI